MGWKAEHFDGSFTSLAAISSGLGQEFAERVIATARYGTVIYAAVQSLDSQDVFGLVLLAERRNGVLYTKPIPESMGPAEDRCPARVLELLSEPCTERAREWRERCRARLASSSLRIGQRVIFAEPIYFTDGSRHQVLTYEGGVRFRSDDGELYRVSSWSTLDFTLEHRGDSVSDLVK
jgi:hypothetical protein